MKRVLRVLKKHKKKSIAVLVLLIISAGSYFAYHQLNKPVYGTVILSADQSNGNEIRPLKSLRGAYISAEYPGRFEQVSNQNPSASLEYWIIVAHQSLGIGQAGQIGLTVSKLPVGGVKEDSAYKQFKAFPERYTTTATEVSGEPAIIAVRTDPTFERTVLWSHGKYLLAASLTANAQTEQLISEQDALLASVQWLQ